jgi:hypothetical protein
MTMRIILLLMACGRTRMGLGRSQATELHGAYCGGHGTPFCPKDRRITTTPFEFKMPKVIAARPLLARRSSA